MGPCLVNLQIRVYGVRTQRTGHHLMNNMHTLSDGFSHSSGDNHIAYAEINWSAPSLGS